ITSRLPMFRQAWSLKCAAAALKYDQAALDAALAKYETLSPGSAQAYFDSGRYLSLNRQYDLCAKMLTEASRREPAWPAPQVELGLMEMQSAEDDKAMTVLKDVAVLDPFNKRAANSLFLLEDLQSYARIETPHFTIRYKGGVDDVMAELMADEMERIYTTVTTRFEYEPPRKTVIELMPDHERFAVRITGMPAIHTIAACTGPLIAIESAREGAPNKHLGLFDWPRVIQHEFTHTVTLAQTGNRVPHWLTEAAAVSMEPGPRTYETCQMLAQSYAEGSLFNLDEIKWAFVRPKQPNDRSKAYAQGFWMVQYINERFGNEALVELMDEYNKGEREKEAIPEVLKISREQFFSDFLVWAGQQVKSWGLAPDPPMDTLLDELRMKDPALATAMEASQQARIGAIAAAMTREIGLPSPGPGRSSLKASGWPDLIRPPVQVSDKQLTEWLGQYPDHPDLLELRVRRLLDTDGGEDSRSTIDLLKRYAALRPVDPYPHKKLAQIALAENDVPEAIEHLEVLDSYEDKSPVYAVKLAELYRGQKNCERALLKIRRAVNINPYSAPNHELAAAIAIEAGKLDVAKQHLEMLTKIEPDRPQHKKRLEAIEKLIAAKANN
ncbi:MAG TPA: hypothetical protein VG711_04715, partial [Phycisphaerales bacterium]|nr:hypothetical protein [Phycisphaerales bacterium]